MNANFPLVNPRFGTPKQERAVMLRSGWTEADASVFANDLTIVFRGFLAEIRSLAQALPNQDFVVRPHPFESERPFQEAAEGLTNVTVDGSGTALEAVRNACVVLHVNCTTAIEGLMLGVLPLHLGYLDTPRTAAYVGLPGRISQRVKSRAELQDILTDIRSHTSHFDFDTPYEREVQPYFHLRDGRAAERVADILVARARRGPRQIALADVMRASRASATFGQKLKGLSSLALGSVATQRLRAMAQPARRVKFFAVDTVATRTAEIAAICGSAAPHVSRAQCRSTGLPLASILVRPAT